MQQVYRALSGDDSFFFSQCYLAVCGDDHFGIGFTLMIGFALTIEVGVPAGVSYFVVIQAVGGVLVQRVNMSLWIFFELNFF